MLLLNKKFGYYLQENMRIVPYQHHSQKGLWKVMINKDAPDKETSKTHITNVVAMSAMEAAASAIRWLDHYEAEQKLIKERLEHERAKTTTGTERKLALDKLQPEADQQQLKTNRKRFAKFVRYPT